MSCSHAESETLTKVHGHCGAGRREAHPRNIRLETLGEFLDRPVIIIVILMLLHAGASLTTIPAQMTSVLSASWSSSSGLVVPVTRDTHQQAQCLDHQPLFNDQPP